MKRQQKDKGPDTNAAGADRYRSRHRQYRRIIAVLDEMVLGQPNIVVAKLLEAHDFIQMGSVYRRIRPPPLRRIAKIEHYAEFHDAPLRS